MFSLFGNETTAATWHPAPNYRGTYGLLSSCIITMGICVWTAVHLNIPEHNKVYMQKWRKAGWLVLALLAPKLVAYTAWKHFNLARKVTKDMRAKFGQESTGLIQSLWWRAFHFWSWKHEETSAYEVS